MRCIKLMSNGSFTKALVKHSTSTSSHYVTHTHSPAYILPRLSHNSRFISCCLMHNQTVRPIRRQENCKYLQTHCSQVNNNSDNRPTTNNQTSFNRPSIVHYGTKSTPFKLKQKLLTLQSGYNNSYNTDGVISKSSHRQLSYSVRHQITSPHIRTKTKLFDMPSKSSGSGSCLNLNKSLCRQAHHQSQRVSSLSLDNNDYVLFLKSLQTELTTLQQQFDSNSLNYSDKKHLKILTSRYKYLLNARVTIDNALDLHSELAELKTLCTDEKDEDMKEMMQSEIENLHTQFSELEEQLVEVLVGEEPADTNDIVLEVSAGVGGQEAMLFCADLFHMYCQYAQGQGWTVALVARDEIELGGYRKASIEVGGVNVFKTLKFEAGVHRVQRVPKTEKAGRVHTSTVTVSVLPQPREIDIQLDRKDLKVDTFRNSGPGGQSVNTTDSAVRITHLPTGTVAECKQERTQTKNMENAMKTLKLRLYQAQLEEEEAARRSTRKLQIGNKGRSEKIRTYNYQQDRVTDHRVKENYNNLPAFLDGGEGLHELISSLSHDYSISVVHALLEEFTLSRQSSKKSN